MAREAIDWEARIRGWHENAPMCACGCGYKVAVNAAKAQADRAKSYKYRPYIQGHNFRQVGALQLTARERSIILGTLLGDAWCGYPNKKSTMPKLAINHSIKQEDYSEWKAAELIRLNAKVNYVPNPGWGDTWARVETSCHESLKEFHDLFYSKDGKEITNQLAAMIDPLALAVWVGDDGSLSMDYQIHTEGFSKRSVDILSAALWYRGVENTTYTTPRDHTLIYTNRAGTRKLAQLIKPHLPDCIGYKLWHG